MSADSLLAAARTALRTERRAGLRPVALRVVDARPVDGAEDQGVWRLQVEADVPLDEDGSWVGAAVERQLADASPDERTPPWRAEILEVDADTDALFVAADAPWPGDGACRLWPYDFLKAPTRLLEEPAYAFVHARLALHLARAAGDAVDGEVGGPAGLLPAWRHGWSLLWGPPGTGKTHTIVEQVATLLSDPDERVLVLSTTNRATDEVALRLGARLGVGHAPHGVWRMGRVVRPADYADAGLAGMLPPETAPLVTQLDRLHQAFARTRDRPTRARLFQDIRELERRLPSLATRATDDDARCLLATVHAGQRAVVADEVAAALRDGRPPFTTVVVDEAGLVPRVLAATVALLASRRVVLVGDPRQLSPIARATRSMPPDVMTWVARSALDHLRDDVDAPHVHRLDVQRRMHPTIRHAVSALSYDGRLRDGGDVAERAFPGTLANLPRAAWYVVDAHHPDRPAEAASRRGPRGRSRVRPVATDVLDALVEAHPALRRQDVLLVTPFRAQRDHLAAWIRAQRLPGWRASTVHAQQGAEADVVVFDTVHASSTSWPAEEWVRLVNVGMSRARHLLFVVASRAEMAQPFLRPLRRLLTPRALVPRGEGRVWVTLDPRGHVEAEAPDLFAPAAPVAAEPDAAPVSAAPSLGAQLARRAALRPVLSHEQARLVHRDLSDAGPRLVRGVAGSGKTLVLAHWVVRALRGLGIPEVDVVYANRALRPLIERLIAEAWEEAEPLASVPWQRIRLTHIAELLAGLRDERGLPHPTGRDRFDYEAQATALRDAWTPTPRLHAAFLDEAQDLGHATVALIVDLVRPRDDGHRPVLVFYDNAQNVYGRGTPRWADLGLDLRGRADVMRESFRGTRPATEFALGTLDRLRPLDEDPDLRALMRPDRDGAPAWLEAEGEGASRRWHARFCAIDGQPPALRTFPTRDEEIDFVVAQVARWVRDERVPPGRIAVISNDKAVRHAALDALVDRVPAIGRTSQGFVDLDAVVVTTAHSFKGYDAELVVVVGADTFATARDGPLHAPLYVAMTRARTALLVTATEQVDGSAGARVVAALRGAIAPWDTR